MKHAPVCLGVIAALAAAAPVLAGDAPKTMPAIGAGPTDGQTKNQMTLLERRVMDLELKSLGLQKELANLQKELAAAQQQSARFNSHKHSYNAHCTSYMTVLSLKDVVENPDRYPGKGFCLASPPGSGGISMENTSPPGK